MYTRRTASKLIASAALATGLAGAGPAARAARRRTDEFDVAVIGAGAFGAWISHALHARGQRVVLVDAYGPANNHSSSGGETRIIRSAYGTQSVYARMAREALPMWRALERRQRVRLFVLTGVLTVHRDGTPFGEESARSLRELGIPFERLTAAEVMGRFPQFRLTAGESALFEPEAGALMARRAVQTLVAELRGLGVEYRQAAVTGPTGSGTLDEVNTHGGGAIRARRFVFACGAWLPKVFPALLDQRIHAQRGEVFFLGVPAGNDSFAAERMPTWIDHVVDGGAYGMPDIESRGCKVAVDTLDRAIDPDTGDRTVTAPYIASMREFVGRRFPALAEAPIVETRVCQYEMTASEDYILDRHPTITNAWIAGGGSGHGFKTSPVVGRTVANLVLGESPAEERFSIAGAKPVT
jgi:sarcosine oxidase